MDLARFTGVMEARGCTHQDKTFCGTYQGWPFSAGYARGGARNTVFTLRVVFGQRATAELFRQMRGAVKGLAGLTRLSGNNANVLLVSVSVKDDASLERVFDTLVQAVARSGLSLPQNCPICKAPGCDSVALADSGYQPVHAACVLNKSAAQQQKVRKNEAGGSYGLGFLGAVLGGIVGCVPTILSVVLAGVISAWLCALIPLGAYGGYRLLRGKLTRVAAVIVIVISVVLVPIMHYFTVAFTLLKEIEVFATPGDYIQLFQLAGTDGWMELGQFLLFTGIGVVLVLGIILRGNQHIWNEAAFAAATLRPLQAGGAYSPLPQPAPAQDTAPAINMQDAPAAAVPGELE